MTKKKVVVEVDDYLYRFYQKIGKNVGLPVEQVMADALFRLAGELSLQVLPKK